MKRNSLFFFCLHLQSVAIANNFNSVTLYSAATVNTINKKAMQEQEIYGYWKFFFVRFSLSLSTLFHHFHPTSKEQHSRLFYITHHPATNTSLNKRRSEMHIKKKRNSLFIRCQSSITYIYSRYSGICLLGNIDSGKMYR